MKISGAKLDALRVALAPFDTAERRQAYRQGSFPRAEAVRDLDKRYRWDLYYAAGSWRILDALCDVASDYTMAHLDTALRRVVPPLAFDVSEH